LVLMWTPGLDRLSLALVIRFQVCVTTYETSGLRGTVV
jgi:hypothetical protein